MFAVHGLCVICSLSTVFGLLAVRDSFTIRCFVFLAYSYFVGRPCKFAIRILFVGRRLIVVQGLFIVRFLVVRGLFTARSNFFIWFVVVRDSFVIRSLFTINGMFVATD